MCSQTELGDTSRYSQCASSSRNRHVKVAIDLDEWTQMKHSAELKLPPEPRTLSPRISPN